MLSHLRAAVAPVSPETFARFIGEWQGLDDPTPGTHRLRDALRRLEGLALSISEWEGTVLPARVPGYRPQHLDALLADGSLVWVASGSPAQRQGRVAFYLHESFDALATISEPRPEALDTPLSHEIIELLSSRGAAFVQELLVRVVEPAAAAVETLEACLIALLLEGVVTNDTALPLRGLGQSPARRGPTGRTQRRAPGGADALALKRLGGRWSLVSALAFTPKAPTEMLFARITTLLGRYGALARNMMAAEPWPGGFAALYEGLKLMEERGVVRRGHSVEGLNGPQFASPQAVERLRRARDQVAVVVGPIDALMSTHKPDVRLLGALDPANPWGAIFDFPTGRSDAVRPKRLSRASIITVDGAPALWVSPNAGRLLTLWTTPPSDAVVLAVFQRLAEVATQHRDGLLINSVDGDTPRVSAYQGALREAGFRSHSRGLILYPHNVPTAKPLKVDSTSADNTSRPDATQSPESAARRIAARRAMLRRRRR